MYSLVSASPSANAIGPVKIEPELPVIGTGITLISWWKVLLVGSVSITDTPLWIGT